MAAQAVTWVLVLISAASAFMDGNLNLYDRDGPTTSGSYFMLGFLPNLRVDRLLSPAKRQLLITTNEPEPVNFTVYLSETLPAEMRVGFPLTATVAYGEVKIIDFHPDIATESTVAGKGIERSKAIRVVTESGKKISVKGFSDDTRTSDGFTGLSCDGMTTPFFRRYEYVAFSAGQNTRASRMRRSAILVIPCEDNTLIRIEPTQTLTLVGLSDLPVPPPFRVLASSYGDLRANAGQTILLTHTDDLSGTVFRSSKPLAVFSGHECANVLREYDTCDHIVEQLPPGLTFGSTFFIVPYAGRASGDMIRVATLTGGTQVTVTCATSADDTPSVLQPVLGDSLINRGEYLTYLTPGNSANSADYKPSYCCLNASKPVVVAQYGTGFSSDARLLGKAISPESGDPMMSIVPPVTHYINNYTFTSLSGSAGPFPDRYVSIAIAAQFFDNSPGAREMIKMNGTAVSPLDGYIPLYCGTNEVCGYGAQFEVPAGTLNIYHQIPNNGLMVSYYAYQLQNSYGFTSDYQLPPVSATRAVLEDITVPENVGNVTISVLRLGDLNQRSRGTLTYRLLGPGEARVGEDFADFGPVLLDYRGGNRRVEVLEFVITIKDDDIPEPPEKFRIYGENTNNLLFPFPFMTVTITDDDEAGVLVVYFDQTSHTTHEGDGSVTLVLRTNVAGGPPNGSVVFYTEDSSATAPEDYTSVSKLAALPVRFESGKYTTTVTISTQNDTMFEENESFFVRLQSTGSANVSIIRDRAEVLIINDDIASETVSIVSDSYEVQESDEFVNIVVRRIGSMHFTIEGQLTTLAGSATDTTDFTGGVYSFTIQPNEQETRVRVPILNDEIVEQMREEFSLVLSVQSQPGLSLGNTQTSIYIIDNDGVTISLSPSTLTLSEGSEAVFSITAVGVSDLPYSVVFQCVDGTAHAPGDYTPLHLTLNREQLEGSGYTVAVPVLDDEVVEGRERFQGRLSLPQETLDLGVISLADESLAEVTIIDNDIAHIGIISSSVYTVSEGEGSVIFFIQNHNPILEREIIVEITTTDGTAIDGVDYIGIRETFTFEAGQNVSSVEVNLTEDDEIYETFKNFSLRITSSDFNVEVTNDVVTVHIVDNDEIVVQFNPTSLSVIEGGYVEAVIQKIGISEVPVTATLSTVTGTADSSDYMEISDLRVTFEPSEVEKRVTIHTIEDRVVEGQEEFTAVLRPVSDRLSIAADTLHINVEESTDVVVEFQPNSYIVNENEGMVRFILVKRTQSAHDVTVHLSTVDGSAKSDSDYTPSVDKAVTFRPFEQTKTVMVSIKQDTVFEGEEVFSARLSVGPDSSGVVIGRQGTATTSIIDDISISFSSPEYTATEDSGAAEVCLTTSAVLSRPATVVLLALESLPVDARDGKDFIGDEYSVEIPAGVQEHCTHIAITDDSVALEGDEVFSVVFDVSQLPDGMELGLLNTSTITIIDNDVVRVVFEEENYGVTEGSDPVSVCVRREGHAAESFSINITTSDTLPVQAEAGSDYQPVSVSLTFAPDDGRQCFQVSVLVDQLDEGKEDFRAVISTTSDNIVAANVTESVTISILDSHGAKLVNDSVIADPLFTAPVGNGDAHFCYEIHGEPNKIFNLVSDKCTVVNAEYIPMRIPRNGNIIGAVGVRAADSAGNCHNIEVHLSPSGSRYALDAFIDGQPVSGVERVDSVSVRRYTNRVRVSVPNCELVDLVMWVSVVEMRGERLIKFVITRGVNLTPTSHGLIGQFWNVPVSMSLYHGPLRPGYEQFFTREKLYLITVTPVSGETRSFLGEQHHLTWDRRSGPCYYAGNSQGGSTAEREENESVIEGHYTDYKVGGLFADEFVYSQFERDRCTTTA